MPSPRRSRRLLAALPGAVLLGALASALLGAAPALAASPSPTPVPTSGTQSVVEATASCAVNDTTACVRGALHDDNGNPVKGVTIQLTPPSGTAVPTRTDANGSYVYTVKKAGAYRLALVPASLPKGIKAAAPSRTVQVSLGQLTPGAFALTGTFSGSKSTAGPTVTPLTMLWDQISNGLLLGLLLALASIGLSLIYGTTGLSNFAHGEQVTLGGILAWTFGTVLQWNFLVACIVTVLVCGLSGYVQDRLIWGPLRRRGLGLTQLMVVTIGLSLALSYVFQYFAGAGVHALTPTIQLTGGPLDLTANAYLAMLISIVVLVAVGLALQRTRIGRATRAVSDNRALAAASGIDVDRIIRLVWTVSMALAGLAGILYGLVYGGVNWATGQAILLLMFAATTLGGLGTAFGALVGSIVIGLVVQVSSLFLSGDLRYATALLILILVLLFRPQGILGRRERVG
ncbi:branched-chain amino acid ABC transporter permease [Amnibacterium sp. CER49]|uniref:ABC transporter permease subunit n=1 Tax=Amnibacterium sp. CER49 TaxID=3039161 RepID=UPI002446A446|nr:branched-chain amino acid ABC transporter permease [Amnibacterium sp. CER49]MDH2443950.1 branched-chain amino acid ABC transporter permease [Amnibacterium sp. CER49]